MENLYNRIRSIDTDSNRWITPVIALLIGFAVVGLATMFVAPMFRRDSVRQLQDEGRGIKKRATKRSSAAVKQIKEAVEDVSETIQDQADKVKKTVKKKI